MQKKLEIFMDLKNLFSNNKKIFGLMIVSLMLVVMFSGVVSAQEGQSAIVKTYENTIKPILNGIFGEKGLAQDDMLLRTAFLLLIFSVLYGASNFIFKAYAKNIRITIALIIAIISTVFMPGPFLYTIGGLYGGIFVALFLAVPIVGGIYLMFGPLKDPTRVNYAMKFGTSAILFYVTGRLAYGSTHLFAPSGLSSAGISKYTTLAGTTYAITSLMSFASAIFFFMAIYFLIRAFTAEVSLDMERKEKGEISIKDIGENIKDLKGVFKEFKRDTRIQLSKIDDIIKDLGRLKGSIAASDDKAGGIVRDLKPKISNVLGTSGKIAKDIDKILKSEPDDELSAIRSDIIAKAGSISGKLSPDMDENQIDPVIEELKTLRKDIAGAVAKAQA